MAFFFFYMSEIKYILKQEILAFSIYKKNNLLKQQK